MERALDNQNRQPIDGRPREILGSESQCGWVKDKFGLSVQIVPARLLDLIRKPNAMQAMLKMKKLDIAVTRSLRCRPNSLVLRPRSSQ